MVLFQKEKIIVFTTHLLYSLIVLIFLQTQKEDMKLNPSLIKVSLYVPYSCFIKNLQSW